MSLDLTPDQIIQLQNLGLIPPTIPGTISKLSTNISEEVKSTQQSPPTFDQTSSPPKPSSQATRLLPLLSISGLTFLSFGGLILLKSKTTANIPATPLNPSPEQVVDQPTPTQVPKSIQHYLLTSQQFFTQALEFQAQKNSDSAIQNLNQSIIIASEAIKTFPSDSRAYEQRGRIYSSLLDSQPQLLPVAISDMSQAAILNPNSAEITRTLATLFARQGDAKNTLAYLTQTVNLQPTVAQNFYDLAHIQQQTGLLPEALATYTRLLTIVVDPGQKTAVETEKSAIEKLLAQSPKTKAVSPTTNPTTLTTPFPTITSESPLLQANASNDSGLIIAAPETSKNISVSNLSSSNALSGTGTLLANTKSISITNSNLKETSQVYLTVTKGGKNLTLQVLSKSKDSFIVGLDAPTTEAIDFKFWIINP